MRTGILTFEKFLGKKDIGSSRIRGHWIVEAWKKAGEDIGDCEIFKFGVKYDAVIFQKAYFVEYAKQFQGVKILDICDPDWMHWSFKFKEMIDECDAVTCSSQELVNSISKFTDKPVYFIPDRVQLENLPEPKKQVGETKTLVWFGYSTNFPILDSAIKLIQDLKMDLIVISDGIYAQPSAFKIKVSNLPWSQHYLEDIQRGDVVINPKHSKGKWKFKSDNKTSIAKALGVPVAHDGSELKNFLTEEQRQQASLEGLEEVKRAFDIKLSVIDYKNVIKDILNKKNHEQ